MKMKLTDFVIGTLAVAGLVLAFGGTAFAFGGCVNSPENPTWLLAGIGAVAAGVPWLRAKLKRRRK
ncbi:MAG: PExPT-CTERM protein [Gammaproteobacteria bacterium]